MNRSDCYPHSTSMVADPISNSANWIFTLWHLTCEDDKAETKKKRVKARTIKVSIQTSIPLSHPSSFIVTVVQSLPSSITERHHLPLRSKSGVVRCGRRKKTFLPILESWALQTWRPWPSSHGLCTPLPFWPSLQDCQSPASIFVLIFVGTKKYWQLPSASRSILLGSVKKLEFDDYLMIFIVVRSTHRHYNFRPASIGPRPTRPPCLTTFVVVRWILADHGHQFRSSYTPWLSSASTRHQSTWTTTFPIGSSQQLLQPRGRVPSMEANGPLWRR